MLSTRTSLMTGMIIKAGGLRATQDVLPKIGVEMVIFAG